MQKSGYEIITDRINNVMQSQGITQTKLAELTGISRPSINRAVNGNPCRYSTIWEIASALDVFPGYLLGLWEKPERFTEYTTLNGAPIFFEPLKKPLNYDA